jgi:uncharacterized protein (DUF488 family)
MKLYTSNYARHAKDPNAVCISVKAPYWYKGKAYYPLAPTWELVRAKKAGEIDEKEYTIRYLQLLEDRGLDPKKVAEELGDGAIMLCYESPKDFCHRQIVSWWMNKNGISVEEVFFKEQAEKADSTVERFLKDE